MSSGDHEGEIQVITSYRLVRPPSLKQYVWRRAVAEAAKESQGEVGTMHNPESGCLAPRSAVSIQERLKDKTSASLLKEHPEWRDEWRDQYGR